MADRYDAFLGAISKLGGPEIFNQTAQDVTEEYVDLEARIANKKRIEERILELLEESQGAIKDVIEVERELVRVRGEIEQMEGRLRFLENRTALTTVTINAVERQSYVRRLKHRRFWATSINTAQKPQFFRIVGQPPAVA